ncbi:hypothetical protein D3C72_2143870 [compost metagenome]
MHPRLLQLAGRLPVGHAWRRLHQHKRLALLQAAHQIVEHGGIAGQPGFILLVMPHRVAVPGNKIYDFRHLPIIVIIEIFHKVGGGR